MSRNEDSVVRKILDMLDVDAGDQPYVLACRNDVCLSPSMFDEWLCDCFNDAVSDTVRALSVADADEHLRLCILSGEGDDEVYGVTAYLFEDDESFEDFVSDYGTCDNVTIITELEDRCDYVTTTMFELVCNEREVHKLLK